MASLVYKVCTSAEWREAASSGAYTGSADDRRDGFIHLSTAEQLAGTLARHFTGRTELVLIALDSRTLAPHLKWEPSRGGMLFPHLYRALDPELATSITALPLDADGRHVLPEGLA